MADQSNIAWTKSTFNPWIGCTKVGPGCDGCYAEALDNRMQYGGGKHWGNGVPRYRTKPANWAKPLAWNKAAPESEFAGRHGFWPVFCASLADVFDNEVPFMWRVDLWNVIRSTPNLSWLLVTKRIGNVSKMVPWIWMRDGFPHNVRLLITVVNQEEADRDIPKLLALPCKNGVSYEPALGPVHWSPWLPHNGQHPNCSPCRYGTDPINGGIPVGRRLEWIIPGGESDQPGHKARPHNIEWARSTVAQCKAAGVPVFVKQIGSQPRGWCAAKLLCDDAEESGIPDDDYCDLFEASEQNAHCERCYFLNDRAGTDPAEWPEDLRVREFPL